MPHRVEVGPNADIMILIVYGDLDYEAIVADNELCLNEGRPIYILMDVSEMTLVLPDGFLEAVRRSWFVNPNMKHMALYSRSVVLTSLANMVAKLTRHQAYLTIYDSREAALKHLLALQSPAKVS